MNEPNHAHLEAHSKQPLWPILTLLPVVALLAWVAWDVGETGAFSTSGRGRWLANFPVPWVQAFFYTLAAICAACAVLAIRRRLAPRTELTIDRDGVTSNLMWGRGTLRWNEISHLEARNNWLFVHGRPSGAPKPKKLVVALNQLDRPPDEILKRIKDARPDLFT